MSQADEIYFKMEEFEEPYEEDLTKDQVTVIDKRTERLRHIFYGIKKCQRKLITQNHQA